MPEEKKKSSGLLKIGCILFILCGLLCVGIIGGTGWFLYSTWKKPCNQYVELINQEKYEDLYNKLSEGWKNQMTLEQFTAFEKQRKELLGDIKKISFTLPPEQQSEDAEILSLEFNTEFENDTGSIIFTLKQVELEYFVQYVEYKSPKVEKAIKEGKLLLAPGKPVLTKVDGDVESDKNKRDDKPKEEAVDDKPKEEAPKDEAVKDEAPKEEAPKEEAPNP